MKVFLNQSSFNVESVKSEVSRYKNVPSQKVMEDMKQACELGIALLQIQKTFSLKKKDLGQDSRIQECQPRIDAFSAARKFSKILEQFGLSYAIGGALASGLWSVPRATLDVDITIGAMDGTKEYQDLMNLLIENNAKFCDAGGKELVNQDPHSITNKQMNVLIWGMKFDIFLPHEDHPSSPENIFLQRKLGVQIGADTLYFFDVESICIAKLMSQRCKDIPDLERLFASHPQLDCDFISKFLSNSYSEDDSRWATFKILKNTYTRQQRLCDNESIS